MGSLWCLLVSLSVLSTLTVGDPVMSRRLSMPSGYNVAHGFGKRVNYNQRNGIAYMSGDGLSAKIREILRRVTAGKVFPPPQVLPQNLKHRLESFEIISQDQKHRLGTF